MTWVIAFLSNKQFQPCLPIRDLCVCVYVFFFILTGPPLCITSREEIQLLLFLLMVFSFNGRYIYFRHVFSQLNVGVVVYFLQKLLAELLAACQVVSEESIASTSPSGSILCSRTISSLLRNKFRAHKEHVSHVL